MNSNMTSEHSVLHRLINAKDYYVTLGEYQEEQTDLFERLLNGAYENKNIGDEEYRRLAQMIKMCEGWEETFQHYSELFDQLIESLQENIKDRLITGSEYIETIGKDHKNYVAAMKRYEILCAEFERSRNIGA